MKKKLTIELPNFNDIVAGLDDLHPPLGRAQAAVADAERKVAAAREDLAKLGAIATALPARVQRGDAPASAVFEALRKRDAAALLIAPAEAALVEARARVTAEEGRARKALAAEVARRSAQLQRVADELAPILEELSQLDFRLGKALDRANVGTGVHWPVDLTVEIERGNTRQQMAAAAAAQAGLTPWGAPLPGGGK